MSRQVGRTSQFRRSQIRHQFCPASARPPHTTCLGQHRWRRPPALPPRRFRYFSPPHPAFSCLGPRSRRARLLLASASLLLVRSRCFPRSPPPLSLPVSSSPFSTVRFSG